MELEGCDSAGEDTLLGRLQKFTDTMHRLSNEMVEHKKELEVCYLVSHRFLCLEGHAFCAIGHRLDTVEPTY